MPMLSVRSSFYVVPEGFTITNLKWATNNFIDIITIGKVNLSLDKTWRAFPVSASFF